MLKTWLIAVKGLVPIVSGLLVGLGVGSPTFHALVQESALALLEVALKLYGS